MSITIKTRLPLFCILLVSCSLFAKPRKLFTIMLNPSGDAKHAGRQLDDSFERGVTLQCAEHLKQVLENRHKNIRVVLTRFPGETLQPLQNANFANRLNVDLYLSLHFYHEIAVKPQLCLYQFSYNDTFITKTFDLSFYPYDQAHLINVHTTNNWGILVKKILEQHKKQFDFKGFFKIPFRPLISIKAPALAVEASLKKKDDWHHYIEPLAESIGRIIKVST